MSSEADQSSNLVSEIPDEILAIVVDSTIVADNKDHSMTSSSTMAYQTMVKKEAPTPHEY
jgi:hypothetical protein